MTRAPPGSSFGYTLDYQSCSVIISLLQGMVSSGKLLTSTSKKLLDISHDTRAAPGAASSRTRSYENALMTASGLQCRLQYGLIMMNPMGLRQHKYIRPMSRLQRNETTYNCLPKFIGDAKLYKMYHSFGLKVQDGEEAINSLKSVIRCGLETTLPFIHKLNEHKILKNFMIFAGRDIIVGQEIIFEAVEEYKGLDRFHRNLSIRF
ncbi:unnamed protein product [Caenorhabditis sp. 36 PRJEB53466]|nr:unnamed protein product [Caenorhabditis sp. 36 PRJEB53466]